MGWSSTVLSTTGSLAGIESEIASLTQDDWDDKIALAKKILGRRLETMLSQRGYSVDEASGESLLDLIANPVVFDMASDYLSLHLIFSDLSLSMGREPYRLKADHYRREFEAQYALAVQSVHLDTDLDGDADVWRPGLFHSGRIKR